MAPTLSVSCPGWHPSTPRFNSVQIIVRIHGDLCQGEGKMVMSPVPCWSPEKLGATGVVETAPENSESSHGKDRPGWVNPGLIDK